MSRNLQLVPSKKTFKISRKINIPSRFNPSVNTCWKGCDYAQGRVNDPILRF